MSASSGKYKLLLHTAALAVLAYTLWTSASGMTGAGAIGLIAFLALLFFANVDRIEQFRASSDGFEAKTRDVVQRAETTLEQLQTLSCLSAKTLASLLVRSGRIGGVPESEQQEVRKQILGALDTIGIPKSKHDDILSEVHRFAILDLRRLALGPSNWVGGIPASIAERHDKLYRVGLDAQVPPDEIESWLKDAGLLTPERKAFLEDYVYYLTHRKHRRPDVFAASEEQ